MTEVGQYLFKSDDSPCLNNGATLAHFQSSGNMPDIRDLLNRSYNGPGIISAHSRINLAEILSSPVALVFDNPFRWVKTSLVVVGRKQNLLQFSAIFS